MRNAYSLGLEYRDPKYWWISANVNYITNSYLDIAQFPEQKFSIKIQQTVSIFRSDWRTGCRTAKTRKFDPISLVNLVVENHGKSTVRMLGFFASINNAEPYL
jgi:hypothetical protein